MSTTTAELTILRCEVCQHASLPGDGPCPRCGSRDLRPLPVAPRGKVIAATELLSVANGWTSPHRLAIVEVPEGVRLLAIVDGELPSVGSMVELSLDHGLYRASDRPPGAEEALGRPVGSIPP
ncbi:MAG: hypothetical protein WCA77_04845 [Thermoplasmata archaeon]